MMDALITAAVLMMSIGGRVRARIGGLSKDPISKWDGLREGLGSGG